MSENQLAKLREQVDQINLQILELLNERGKIVQAIGEEKKKTRNKSF